MLGEKPYSLTLVQPLFMKFPLFSSHSPPFYPSSPYRSVPASWNCGILPERIIHLLTTGAPLGVSSNLSKSRLPPWLSLRASLHSDSCGQWSRTWRGVSSPMSHSHCPDSYPGTLTLCRKCRSPVLPVLSCISIELSALRRPLWSRRIVGSGGSFNLVPEILLPSLSFLFLPPVLLGCGRYIINLD